MMLELKAGDAVSYTQTWDNNRSQVGIVKSADSSCVTVTEDLVGLHEGHQKVRRWISNDDLCRYQMSIITHEERKRIIKSLIEIPRKPSRPLNRVFRPNSAIYGLCFKCGSQLAYRIKFELPACLQYQCSDYYGHKMTVKQFMQETIKLYARRIKLAKKKVGL